MSNQEESNASGGKEMKGLVAAAAMMAADGDSSASKKRKSDNDNHNDGMAMPMAAATSSNAASASALGSPSSSNGTGRTKDLPAARARRLEQNRRAAIESRRRKKVMVAELQRSVTFYTKANENLTMDNIDLEQRLFQARRKVAEMMKMNGDGTGTVTGTVLESAAAGLKSPPEELLLSKSPAPTTAEVKNEYESKKQPSELMSSHSHNNQNHQHLQQPTAAAVPVAATVPFPSLHPSVSPHSPTKTERAQSNAQLSATQALYETMGYPTGAARVAANTFSQFVGLTGTIPSTTTDTDAFTSTSNKDSIVVEDATSLDAKPSAVECMSMSIPTAAVQVPQLQFPLPSEEEVGSDKYIESLKKFAMEQTAAANAAAAAANAAIQAMTWHKMMKAKNNIGEEQPPQPQQQQLPIIHAAPVPSMPPTTTAVTALMQPSPPMSYDFPSMPPMMSSTTNNVTAHSTTTTTTVQSPPAPEEDNPPTKKQKI